MNSIASLLLVGLVGTAGLANAEADWKGFARVNFTHAGKPCFVTSPKIAAPGKPWVWRTSFPDYHPEVDLELLRHGWHVAFIDCTDMLGCDAALDIYDSFYQLLRKDHQLAARPAMEAVSRGGMHAYLYAARHPERIACIHADAPVMDLTSWPLGWPGATKETADALRSFGLKDKDALLAFRGNPIDRLEPIARAKIPLRHVVSLNDAVVPPEKNTLEAKRRLEKLGHTMDVVTVAEGTPASNGHHYPLPAVHASARFIMRHTATTPDPAGYHRTRSGLANSRARFEQTKTGRVAFLGGSITFNGGWRDAVMRDLQQRFPQTRFEFIAAGIPSVGSVPHAFRLENDVLKNGPVDLLFVEAAVNDHNYDGYPEHEQLALRGMEGVVRHARTANPRTDVVLLHFIHDQHLKTWADGETPYTVAAHEKVAERYRCPSLNLSREVSDRIRAGQLTWRDDFRDLHPSPYGQQLYANSIACLLDDALATAAPPADHPLPQPVDPASYAHGRFGDLSGAKLAGGFVLDPAWQPTDGKGTRAGFVNVPGLVATTPGATLEFAFEGTAAGLMIAAGPDTGIIEVSIDGKPPRKLDTFTRWSAGLHLPWAVILGDGLPPGRHHVKVTLTAERNPKATGTALRVMRLLLN